jgi:hypothetical protein
MPDDETLAAFRFMAEIWKMIDEAPESSGGSFSLSEDGTVTEERWHTKRLDDPAS